MMRGVEFAFYFILYSLLCNAYSMQFWKEILQYNSMKLVIGRLCSIICVIIKVL